MRFCALLFLVCCYTISFSQDLEIIHVNPENFPVVEAIIHSGDEFGMAAVEYKKEDFTIAESGQQNEVIRIDNPKNKELPLSILMVFDVSGSMKGERIKIVHNAAINFISRVPLQYSEIAIASFNEMVMINSDFTHNKNKLLQTLSNLQVFGGTSYDEAYLNYELGAMEFVRQGKHKKVIVFLTDGMSNVHYEKVIQEARSRDISIYNVTVALPMPEALKQISKQTGGSYYESAQSEGELGSVFLKMLGQIQSNLYGKIYWKAPYGCIAERSGTIEYMDKQYNYSYTIPASKVSKLEVGPDELVFGQVDPGNKKSLNVQLRAINNPVAISQVELFNEVFKTVDPFTSITLSPGSHKKLTIQYTPIEEGQQTANIKLLFENCPDKSIGLSGGVPEQVRIISPVGNDKFLVGIDTAIKWEGIKAEREVDIFYRNIDTVPWQYIGLGENHSYKWTVPDIVSPNVQVKLQPKPIRKQNLVLDKKINLKGFKPTYQVFYPDDSKIILGNTNGELIGINRYTNTHTFISRGMGNKGFCFSKKNNLISFSKNHITVREGTIGPIIAEFQKNKRLYSSYILEDGKEYLVPAIIRRYNNSVTVLRSTINENYDTIQEDRLIRHAAITSDGSRAITINLDKDLKIWDLSTGKTIYEDRLNNLDNTYVVNPNQETMLVVKPDSLLSMFKLEDASELFSSKGYQYIQFAKSGSYFLCHNTDSTLCFFDSFSGILLDSISDPTFCRTFGNAYELLILKNDSLQLFDLKSKANKLSYYSPGMIDYIISPDESKILLLNSSGVHTMIDSDSFTRISELKTEPGQEFKACFSTSGHDVLIQTEDMRAELWVPELINFNEAISENFSIVKPQIEGLDTINLGTFFINRQVNISVNNIYKNNSEFELGIKDVSTTANNFQLVNHPKNYKLKPGDSQGIELGFLPSKEGQYSDQLIAYTQFDTLYTTVYAEAVSTSLELLNNPVNLGTVLLDESKDTTLPVIANTGNIPILINEITIVGPDTNQITLLENKNGQHIQPGDTLVIGFKFLGKKRGRTSTRVQFNLDYLDSLKNLTLFGEVIAPPDVTIAALTYNTADSLPIEADIECVDLESGYRIKQEDEQQTEKKYFKANPGRVLGLFASKKGYLSSSNKIDLTEGVLSDTVYSNLYLTEIKSGTMIRLNCIFFDFNSSTLKAESYSELQKVVEMLNTNTTITIEIQGHTDNVGSSDFNMSLSRKRAQAIKEYIVSKGILKNRLSVKAYGYIKPVASNDDELGRAQNRRVEIMVR